MPIAPLNMVETMGGLAALSKTQAETRQQMLESKEFIDTQNERTKQKNAEAALKTKQAEMDLDIAEDRDEGDRHITHARASDAAATEGARASQISSQRDKEFDLLSGVKDQDSWEVAYHTGRQLGMTNDQLATILGPQETGFNANFIEGTRNAIRFKRENQIDLAKLDVESQGISQRAQTARMEMAGRLAIAEAELQGRLATAAATATKTGKWDIADSPIKDAQMFAAAIAENTGEDYEAAELPAKSQQALRIYKTMELLGYTRANEFKANFPNKPLPDSLNPAIMTKYWIQRAIVGGSGRAETTAAREELTRKEQGFYDEGTAGIGKPGSLLDELWSLPENRELSSQEVLKKYVDLMMQRDTQNVTN